MSAPTNVELLSNFLRDAPTLFGNAERRLAPAFKNVLGKSEIEGFSVNRAATEERASIEWTIK